MSRAAPGNKRAREAARALWFPGRRTAELRAEVAPPPGPGEVRVRTVFSAVSHGTEMLAYRGEVPVDLPLDLPTFAGSFAFPIKYGYAAVGRVLDAGPGVDVFAPGDPVFVHHPHQDVFTVPAAFPILLPADLDPLRAVFFANTETALNIAHDAPLRLGEVALVFGQGTVGLLVTALLKMSGASPVLAVEPDAARRELSLASGADAAFAPGDGLRGRILDRTGGRGADVVVEASGSGTALGAALECVAGEGTVVAASWYGTEPVALTLGGHFHRGRVTVRSSQVGRTAPELSARWGRARRTETVLDLLGRQILPLDRIVSHRMPFDQAPQAYASLDAGADGVVQIVFDYGEV